MNKKLLILILFILAVVLPLVCFYVPKVHATGSWTYSKAPDLSGDDGDCGHNDGGTGDYELVHDAVNSTNYSFAPDSMYVGQNYVSVTTTFSIRRSFVQFNTTTIPASATITAAQLRFYVKTDSSTTDFTVRLQKWTSSPPIIPATYNDFDGTSYDNGVSTSGISTVAYTNDTISNFALITKAGLTNICIRSDEDISASSPINSETIFIYTFDSAYPPYLEVNYTVAPTDDSLILDLTGATYKGTKTLLAQKEDYVFTYKCSDLNGVTDINYSEIRLDYSSKNVILRATRGSGDAWTFSEESDPSNDVTLNVAGSSHSTSGTQKTFNFHVTINWAWGDSAETIGVQAYVIDVSSASDQDDYLNIFGVEAHLTSSTLVVSDYHCDVGATLTFAGYWYYDGTSVTPPNGDYQVQIKLGGVQKGSTDTTLVSGAFSINDVSASTIVGEYNYTVEASYMVSAGGFSPVIANKVNINDFSVLDDRINIGSTATFTVSGIYWYDSAIWTGTYVLNDTTSKSSAGRYNFTVQSITDATYGLTAFNMSVSDLYVIWDALEVSNIQTPIYLGNGTYQYDMEIRYASDNSSIDGASVNVTSIGEVASNSSGWVSFILSQTNLTASGTYTVFGVNDNNYGITVANTNQTFDVSKWSLSTSDIEGNVLSNATINVNSGSTSVWNGQYAIIDLYVPAASYSVNVTWLQSLSLNTTASVSVLSDTSTVLNCTAYPYSFGGSRYDIASNATISTKTFSSSILTLTFSSPAGTYILVSDCPSAPNYITNCTYDLASDLSLSYLVLTHYSNATLSLGCEGWGNLYVYATDKIIKSVTLVVQRLTITTTGLTGEIGTLEVYCGSKGSPPDVGGFTTTSYASSILTGTYSFSSDASLWFDWTTSSGPIGPGGDTGTYSPSNLLVTVFLSFPDSAFKSTVLDGFLNVSWTGMPKIYVWSVTCDSPFEGWRVIVVSGLPFELKMNFTSGYESIPVRLEIPVDAESGALSIPCSVTLATPQGTSKTIRAIVYLTVVSSVQTVPDLLTYSFLGIFAVMIGLTVFRRRRKNQG